MAVAVFSILVDLVGLYLTIGMIAALILAFGRVGHLDPVAKQGTWGFRLLILPGLTVFWPLFLCRLARGVRNPPCEQNAHRRAALRSR